MIKIGYITEGNCHDRTQWSGLVTNIFEIISSNPDYNVQPIQLESNYIVRFCIKAINKINSKINVSGEKSTFIAKYKSRQLNQMLKKNNDTYDLLFLPAGKIFVAYAKTKVPIIYLGDATFHVMIDYYYFNLSGKQKNSGHEIQAKVLANANEIIFASNWAKCDAKNYYGADINKMHVLPFGANLEDRGYVPKKILCNTINLLLVGVDWERKGIQCAIDCVNHLNNNSKVKYILTVVGVPVPKKLNNKNIVFKGFLNKNKEEHRKVLINIYKNSHIFILPTKAECAGIVFSEASMYGLPIVTYDTGGCQLMCVITLMGSVFQSMMGLKNLQNV